MPLTCLDYPGECTKQKPNQREGRTHMALVGRHYDIIWRSTKPKGFSIPHFSYNDRYHYSIYIL